MTDDEASISDFGAIRTFLSVPEAADHDLHHFWGRRAESTCTWILERPQIRDWLLSASTSQLLWIHGRPGRGKSVLASFMTQHLLEKGALVQHFFFRSGDETKRSISALLRSLASQMALAAPALRRRLVELAKSGHKLKESEWRSTWKTIFTSLLFELPFLPPLYWVIDGLDESGSPQHMLDMLADISNSCSPINCLVTSRWSPHLASVYDRVKTRVNASILSIDHDETDIRLYAEEQLSYVSWNPSIKDEVMAKILQQANDNFLWVYLIFEEIKDCHTEDDVRTRLNELPPGMEDLYKRMEGTISSIRRPTDKSLCRQLLLWATYSRRSVSMTELAALLEPEFGQLLNFSNTISKLCGHFIVVEGRDHTALLHQSAREYLMTSSTLPFSLDPSTAHCDLFEKSVSAWFMDRGQRTKSVPLTPTALASLEYRATSWPYHLQSIKHSGLADSHLDLLIKFFHEQPVLLWIQVLATMGQIKVLIEASHALSAFIHRTRRMDVARAASLRRFEDLERLDTWAHDLLKLPGKFGGILSKDPSSIFTSVAPFAPRNSAIHMQFAKSSSSLVNVRGLEEYWDDCLARLSVGSDHLACLIDYSGRHVAVVDDIGTAILWDSTTFQKVRELTHLERVSSICFSGKGDQVATYGSATTKIWSSETGDLLHQFANPQGMSPLSFSFTDYDKALLMASDRRCVFKCSLEGEEATWTVIDASLLNEADTFQGTYQNSPSALAISPDGSMVAAAYRRFPLTIWSINPPKVLRRVGREHIKDRPSAPLLPFASKLSWHPDSEELLGLFLDGYSFRFNVLDGTIREQAPDPGRMPADIQCSPDGLIYAIRGVRGTIKLYDVQSSTLIYQLTSAGDTISAFRFSRDGRRFVQLRGNHCTIWEPNSLIRLSAAEDHAVNSQSSPEESIEQSNVVSEAILGDYRPIVLVSPSPQLNVVCYGDEDGLVELLDHETGHELEIGRTATKMSIEHLAWSASGYHFCYSEISGRVTVIELTSSGETWQHRRVKRFKPKAAAGGITQILLSPDAATLMVASRNSAQTWSVDQGTLRSTCDDTAGSIWAAHPTNTARLVAFRPGNIAFYQWASLGLVSAFNVPSIAMTANGDSDGQKMEPTLEEVDQVIETHLPGHILVIISRRAMSHSFVPRLAVFDMSTEEDCVQLDIPPEVTTQVEIPLNVLPNGRFAFIDRSFRLCSWHLRSTRGAEDISHYFYIPRDWLPDQPSKLLHVTSKGTILCPRKEGLAMIESSIASKW